MPQVRDPRPVPVVLRWFSRLASPDTANVAGSPAEAGFGSTVIVTGDIRSISACGGAMHSALPDELGVVDGGGVRPVVDRGRVGAARAAQDAANGHESDCRSHSHGATTFAGVTAVPMMTSFSGLADQRSAPNRCRRSGPVASHFVASSRFWIALMPTGVQCPLRAPRRCRARCRVRVIGCNENRRNCSPTRPRTTNAGHIHMPCNKLVAIRAVPSPR